MKEKLEIETKKCVVVPTGCVQMIFRRDDKGQIVYDEEGYIGGGGYPYVTLKRNAIADESDIKELLKSLLP